MCSEIMIAKSWWRSSETGDRFAPINKVLRGNRNPDAWTYLNHDPKRMITPVVNRTLHTYHNTLRILCEAFQIQFEGHDHHCERLLVQEAFKIHRTGKMLVPIIDDAHLMPSDCLRKLRLLFEDFPHSHNLVLIGQPPIMQSLALSINEEIRSRITYSVVLPRLVPETIK